MTFSRHDIEVVDPDELDAFADDVDGRLLGVELTASQNSSKAGDLLARVEALESGDPGEPGDPGNGEPPVSDHIPVFMTTQQYGISGPSSNATTNRQALQEFFWEMAEDGTVAVIEDGHWFVDDWLYLPDGLKVIGRGMERTFIRGDGVWNASHPTVMRMDANRSGVGVNTRGLILAHMQVIAPPTDSSNSGGDLVSVRGVHDYELHHLRLRGAQGANLYVSGYGVGSFADTIDADPAGPPDPSNSKFWGNNRRGHIHHIHTIDGMMGIELEGGCYDTVVEYSRVDNPSLHCLRFSAGWKATARYNQLRGGTNGFYVGRSDDIHIHKNHFIGMQRGISYAGLRGSDMPLRSKGLKITDNTIQVTGTGITDAHIGSDSQQYFSGVQITGNYLKSGNMRFTKSRLMNIQNNICETNQTIHPSSNVTGIIGNNLMRLNNQASGVVSIGNNVDPTSL
jgi:hypothetical protein